MAHGSAESSAAKGRKILSMAEVYSFVFTSKQYLQTLKEGLIHILTHPRQLSVPLWKVSAASLY